MLIDNQIEQLKEKPAEFWWFWATRLFLALIVVPHVVLLMFVIYMLEYNFFSYDFFVDGIFGMKLFFITTCLTLVMVSAVLYFPLITLILKKGKLKIPPKTFSKKGQVITYGMTLCTWALFILNASVKGDWIFLIYLAGMCLMLAMLGLGFLARSNKDQFMIIGFVFFIIMSFSLILPEQTSRLVGVGLKAFGMGGELHVSISEKDQTEYVEGKLILSSPNYLYFIPCYEDEDFCDGTATYPKENARFYVVEGKRINKEHAQTDSSKEQD